MGESETPSFRRPPVIETVLGIQFAPLKQWHAGYFGLYWHKVRSQFPAVEIQPPIASKTELAEFPANIRIELLTEPELRAWYLSEDGTELIQIQNDRFLLNWRSTSDEVAYPRYRDRVRPLFIAQWNAYRDFLESEKIESPSIVLCEVTYINHIPKGDGWQVSADWDKVFTVCGNLRGEKFLPDPESRRFGLNYQMPDGLGSLSITASRAIRARDSKEIIQLQLSAKGRPNSMTEAKILDWFDHAHDWIVKGFTELTTKEMHDRWQRTV